MAKATKTQQHSQYWINKTVWDDDLEDGIEIDTKDAKSEKNEQTLARLMRLAGVRRAIGNFVQIMTEKDIPVTFSKGDKSSVNANDDSIVIAADPDPTRFDPMVGLSLHEASHLLKSDKIFPKFIGEITYMLNYGVLPTNLTMSTKGGQFLVDVRGHVKTDPQVNIVKKILPNYLLDVFNTMWAVPHTGKATAASMLQSIFSIAQVLEDRRIDKYVYTTAEGYRPYYDALYDKYFFTKEVGRNLRFNPAWREVTVENYIIRLTLMFHPEAERDALPGLEEIYKIFDLENIDLLDGGSVMEWVDGGNHNYDKLPKVWHKACELYAHILRYATIVQVEPPPPQGGEGEDEQGESNGEGGGEGGGEQQDNQENGNSGNSQPQDKSALEKILEHLNNSLPDMDKEQKVRPKPTSAPKPREKPTFNENRAKRDMQKAQDVMNGKITKKKITAAEQTAVESIEEAAAEVVDMTGHGVPFGNCIVTRKLTDKVINADWFPFKARQEQYYDKHAGIAVTAGRRMGAILANKLQVRNDPMVTKQTRLQQGGLDRRLLAQLGMDITSVFQKSRVDTYRPAMLHLTIDASGSMAGDKWWKCVTVATALAYVSTKVQNIDVVITIRGGIDIPVVSVIFDSRNDSFARFCRHITKLAPNCSTPEGLCFKATLGLVQECAATHDVYFINFSDGEPSYYYTAAASLAKGNVGGHFSYHGDVALKHTRAMVNLIRQSGVKVMSYFISDNNSNGYYMNSLSVSKDNFKKMYGQDAQFVNVQNTTDVLRTLNKLLISREA